ncbi:MAG TPA: metallophosphoesterase [Pirellulales bacterium]|nr:metallophosphoesterase [Pirellulales bacterium]
MAMVTATALWAARRAERRSACFWAALAVGAAAAVLAAGLAEDPFAAMRLLSYGLFGFMPLVSAACAFLHPRSHRRMAAIWLVGFFSLEAIAVDAFLIEPHWLEVSRVRIASPKLSKPVRIALLADLQTDEIGPYERSVIERIAAEKPDLILLAGDYLQVSDDGRRRDLQAELRKVLNESGFAAPYGVFAVQGNVDNADWPGCFVGTEVTAVEETRSFEAGELAITCLSMANSFASGLTVPATERFHIVLGHCPNFALGDVQGDLLLAGHCHGGQVRLPGLGPIITLSRVPRSWAAGVTQLSGGRTLIVSRGAGMERGSAPRLRFLCRPELVFIEIVPE